MLDDSRLLSGAHRATRAPTLHPLIVVVDTQCAHKHYKAQGVARPTYDTVLYAKRIAPQKLPVGNPVRIRGNTPYGQRYVRGK